MIEVFKTDVAETGHAERLVKLLQAQFGGKINFDLQDCDRILRIDRPGIAAQAVVELMNAEGFQCLVLE